MTRPQPRFTVAEKRAHVANLVRIGGGVTPPGHLINAFAEQIGIRRQSVYRWLQDPSLQPEAEIQDEPRSTGARFEVDTNILTVIAQEQSRLSAHAKLREAGLLNVSYATFCRAVDRVDPDVLAGAMSGRKAMADNRVYLRKHIPHVCHTYFLDHTQLDLWVMPDHRSSTPVRPRVTVIGDGHSGYLWAFVWYREPDAAAIAAALATTCVEQEVNGVSIGGIPAQLVLDNAGQHFAGPMRDICTRLGIIVSPTNAYSSWQNGKAERAIQLVNRLVSRDAPGAIRVGSDPSSTRFLPTTRGDIDPESVLSAAALESKVREVLTHINTEIRRKERGGLTRLELFSQDPTDRVFLPAASVQAIAMPTSKGTYRSSKSGIQFRNRHYVAAEISPGREYRVRFLPGNDTFIEVFDLDGKHVARAFHQEALPQQERNRILARRARNEREVRAVEEGLQNHRRHMAAATAQATEDTAVDAATVATAHIAARDPHVSKEPKRKKLPRVRPDAAPVPSAPPIDAPDDPKTQETLAWLNDFNASLQKDPTHED